MELDLFWDRWGSTFDEDDRLPLVLEKWGHTIWKQWVPFIKSKIK